MEIDRVIESNQESVNKRNLPYLDFYTNQIEVSKMIKNRFFNKKRSAIPMKIKQVMNFQGSMKKKNYFEGWYYKLVNQKQDISLAFIPGISLNKIDSHAFIQIFISKGKPGSKSLKTHYLRYSKSDFMTSKNPFSLDIKNQIFKKDQINLDIIEENISLKGKISFMDLTPIKTSFISPSIMGIFSYVPLMECYHGIVSMSHQLKGNIEIDGQNISFDGGKGYIEKDWGKSFPSEYVWMQSNHFQKKKTSLMFSHAWIPFLGLKFKGLIANLIVDGKEYRFATYNFTRVKKSIIKANKVTYLLKKGKYSLKIIAKNQETKSLPAPKKGRMNQTIKEGLSGQIEVYLYHKDILLYHDIASQAGLEIMMKESTDK